jgi:hypothetical protein
LGTTVFDLLLRSDASERLTSAASSVKLPDASRRATRLSPSFGSIGSRLRGMSTLL